MWKLEFPSLSVPVKKSAVSMFVFFPIQKTKILLLWMCLWNTIHKRKKYSQKTSQGLAVYQLDSKSGQMTSHLWCWVLCAPLDCRLCHNGWCLLLKSHSLAAVRDDGGAKYPNYYWCFWHFWQMLFSAIVSQSQILIFKFPIWKRHSKQTFPEICPWKKSTLLAHCKQQSPCVLLQIWHKSSVCNTWLEWD